MTVVTRDDDIVIERLELGPWGTNAYILTCPHTAHSMLVDAPDAASTIIKALQDTILQYIVLTHNHRDHAGALAELHRELKAPLAAHTKDAAGLPVKPDILLNDGDRISSGDIILDVLHTPGHTPGSLCLYRGKYLIAGDTIFPGGPGKTASPEDFHTITKSIRERLFVLPDETRFFPGHGEPSTLGKEKAEYAIFSSRPHTPGLCGDVLWLTS